MDSLGIDKRTPNEQLNFELERRAESGDEIEKLKSHLDKKLYFQFLDSSLSYISNDSIRFSGNDLFCYLLNVILPLRSNFDPLKFAAFVGETIARSSTTIGENVNVLKSIIGNEDYYENKEEYNNASLTNEQNIAPKQEIQGDLYLRCLLALEYSKNKDYCYECEDLLDFLTEKLDKYRGIDTSIMGLYHRSYASFERTMNRMSKFYKQAMLYLTYTPINLVPLKEIPSLVYELVTAAVMSDDIYNLGELVLHPIIQEFSSINKGHHIENIDPSLLNVFKENSWLLEVLVSLHEGDIDSFVKVAKEHQNKLNGTPLSSPEAQISIKKKTTTLALMDLAFKKNKDERNISFDEIASHCRIGINDIELLVMKAINMNLIKGYIDQTSKIVEVTWVRPRVLDKTRIQLLRDKLDSWISSAERLVSHLENVAPELVNY
ncbi:proteasome regulatory subunit Rpn9 [Cryptosporidium ryanae]|uniref:proteasome regulatory subunit Rpn9 n=1 Tax=Cryptosporidium ryanae TaxID=515981 RepID=UPI00351A10CF|nr:proteasome regulatory subunit Rpn9 [Cryptosporidium ryanae]